MLARGMRTSAPVGRIQDDRLDRLAGQGARVLAAVPAGDQVRLVATHEARAGEDDGFEEVPAAADGADLAEVGADAAPLVVDQVAGRAGGPAAEEDGAPAPGIARFQERLQLGQPGLLAARRSTSSRLRSGVAAVRTPSG